MRTLLELLCTYTYMVRGCLESEMVSTSNPDSGCYRSIDGNFRIGCC